MLGNRLSPMAIRIIAREGQTATLTQYPRDDELTYDPMTGDNTGGTTTTCFVKGIVLDYGLISNGMMSKAGTQITLDDKQCYLSPYDVDGNPFPKPLRPNDVLTFADGRTFSVIAIKEDNPSGTKPIRYDILLKRG